MGVTRNFCHLVQICVSHERGFHIPHRSTTWIPFLSTSQVTRQNITTKSDMSKRIYIDAVIFRHIIHSMILSFKTMMILMYFDKR